MILLVTYLLTQTEIQTDNKLKVHVLACS